MDITIHAEPNIDWQRKRANDMAIGLRRIGHKPTLTRSRVRTSDAPAILYGTTCWRDIEAAPGDWLLVDRACVGNPDYVQLVWNGHGRRGDHKVPPSYDGSRWNDLGVEIKPWQTGSKVVLCGQTESYCDLDLEEWYKSQKATHFRKHPAGDNPTRLPAWDSWDDVGKAIVLNSSVAVDAMINGVKAEVTDPGSMAYGWMRRDFLLPWLAWTQWSWDEIRDGEPVRHLFDDL